MKIWRGRGWGGKEERMRERERERERIRKERETEIDSKREYFFLKVSLGELQRVEQSLGGC
jgi:hypothetical protein